MTNKILSKTISPIKLKIKHVLKNHHTLKDYPTADDVLFDLLDTYSLKDTLELKFTKNDVIKRYNISDEKFDELISELLKLEYLIKTEKKNTFQIIENPFS